MMDTDIDAPPLLAQLVSNHQARWIDFDNMEAWLVSQHGEHVLLFAGDPIRFPEAVDVAVVLPELQKVSAAVGRPFGMAVAVPQTAQALAEKFGSQRWPTLMFFRDGHYVTTVCGMHDWTEYLTLVARALDAPCGRAPTIGIPVVSASATGSSCH
jgi:hydrogenase-1 operon protein HyaE